MVPSFIILLRKRRNQVPEMGDFFSDSRRFKDLLAPAVRSETPLDPYHRRRPLRADRLGSSHDNALQRIECASAAASPRFNPNDQVVSIVRTDPLFILPTSGGSSFDPDHHEKSPPADPLGSSGGNKPLGIECAAARHRQVLIQTIKLCQ